MKIAILFDNLGPYHVARLRAASQVCDLLALEINDCSREYPWAPSPLPRGFNSITLNRTRRRGDSNILDQTRRLGNTLTEFAPQCVFIPGWSRGYSWRALAWCLTNEVPAVLMSESTEHDSPRTALKEWWKASLVSLFSAALVGGVAHVNYLAKLGMRPDRVFQGYDAVDNDYFRRMAKSVRSLGADLKRGFGLPEHYFLASARFVEQKNLSRLIEAYVSYRGAFAGPAGVGIGADENRPWSMVLLGDGPGRAALDRQISAEGLGRFVLLPGFKQYPELPVYYGLASAFIHASTSEPWGLVVNEAMASGLPVVVSNRCGCAPDLVSDGRNGYTFDPRNVGQLAELMLRISIPGPHLSAMSNASAEIISACGLSRFAQGLRAAAEEAVALHSQKRTVARSALLRLLASP